MAAAAHWNNWVYRTERRHWHAFWCRWSPDLEITTQFKAERIFEPLESGDGCRMQVVYHYGDERGTVSEGPTSGPWTMTAEECATEAGIVSTENPRIRLHKATLNVWEAGGACGNHWNCIGTE